LFHFDHLFQVKAGTFLYSGPADSFAHIQDANKLAKNLPNVLSHHVIEDEGKTITIHKSIKMVNSADNLAKYFIRVDTHPLWLL